MVATVERESVAWVPRENEGANSITTRGTVVGPRRKSRDIRGLHRRSAGCDGDLILLFFLRIAILL
jgi:hypothetical protein